MIKEKFFPSNAALFTLISACLIVAVFMGLRMVFGLFTDFFVEDLQCTVTQFGLAIGLQMLMWGMFAPIFGALADKIGSAKVTIIAASFVALGIYLLYSGPNTGIFFQINLGLLIGIGLGGTAISVQIAAVGKPQTQHGDRYQSGLAGNVIADCKEQQTDCERGNTLKVIRDQVMSERECKYQAACHAQSGTNQRGFQ